MVLSKLFAKGHKLNIALPGEGGKVSGTEKTMAYQIW